MNTPEGNPNNQVTNIPEGKPEPKALQVKVENPDLILKAIQKKQDGELGFQLLENPLKEITVNFNTTEEDTFNLTAKIDLDIIKVRDKLFDPQKAKQRIAERFLKYDPDNKIKERGRHFIITAPRGTKFIVSGDTMDFHINISTGIYTDFITKKQVLPPPSTNQESYDTVMADFIDVLGISVDEIYKSTDKETIPNEEIILRPPKIKNHSKDGRTNSDSEFITPNELKGKIEIETPNITFDDVGGQAEAKKEIEGISFALKNPDLYRKWGTKPPKGIILYGPPGTGKTLMARALASVSNARFFNVQASDIASKWYGESEKTLKSIFDLAHETGEKTIIFFDEIDAIAPPRDGRSHEATQKTVSTFLESMDGIVNHDNVMIVASTNRLGSVDPALLRPGRFDRWVEVPLPDEKGRKQIFDIHIRKAEKIANRVLFNKINIEEIISATDKTSGADIAEIIRRVLEIKVRQEGNGENPQLVTTEDIIKEIKGYERVKETKKTIGFSSSSD